jgi:hypothetical protein
MDIIQRIQQLILRMILTRKLYPVSSLRFSWLFAKLIMRSVIIISLSACYYSFPLVTILCIRAPNHRLIQFFRHQIQLLSARPAPAEPHHHVAKLECLEMESKGSISMVYSDR